MCAVCRTHSAAAPRSARWMVAICMTTIQAGMGAACDACGSCSTACRGFARRAPSRAAPPVTLNK
eukprot:scaffold6798_cov108-Isochrysis_galbana.AAC.2